MGDAGGGLGAPRYVPFAGNRRSGMRLNIQLRQDLQSMVQHAQHASQAAAAAGKSVQRAIANPGHAVANSVLGVASTVHGWLGKGVNEGDEGGAAAQHGADGADRADARACFALNSGERVDWQLQESELELAAEALSAMQAHNSYFASEDVAAFLVETVVVGDDASRRADGSGGVAMMSPEAMARS